MKQWEFVEMVVRGVTLDPNASTGRIEKLHELTAQGWELMSVAGVTEQVNWGTTERPTFQTLSGLIYLLRREVAA